MNPSDRTPSAIRHPAVRRQPRRSQRGGGALEFALAAPLLLGFLLAMIDLARFVLAAQLAASAATAVADLASQTESFTAEMNPAKVVSGQEIAILMLAAAEVARPVDLAANGALIVTVMANRGSGVETSWQRRWGRTDIVTKISPSGLLGITIAPGESAVYAEVASSFRPWLLSGRLLGLKEDWSLRSVAVRRPRLGGPMLAP